MQASLSTLFENIGTIDESLECLYPLYLLYPEIEKYELIQDKSYFIPIVEKYFKQTLELKPGNLLILEFFNGFHFAIYAGNNEFFHCCAKHKLRLSNLSRYKQYLREIYEWRS